MILKYPILPIKHTIDTHEINSNNSKSNLNCIEKLLFQKRKVLQIQ